MDSSLSPFHLHAVKGKSIVHRNPFRSSYFANHAVESVRQTLMPAVKKARSALMCTWQCTYITLSVYPLLRIRRESQCPQRRTRENSTKASLN
jgi:hypothetical protein